MCGPLVCFCRPFMIFEGCLNSNSECRCSKRARYQLSHPSPLRVANRYKRIQYTSTTAKNVFSINFQEQLERCSGGLPPAAELYINLLDEDETSLATGRADSEEGDDTDASSLVNQPLASQRPTPAQSRRTTPRSSFSSADRSRPAAAAALDLGSTCVLSLNKIVSKLCTF